MNNCCENCQNYKAKESESEFLKAYNKGRLVFSGTNEIRLDLAYGTDRFVQFMYIAALDAVLKVADRAVDWDELESGINRLKADAEKAGR